MKKGRAEALPFFADPIQTTLNAMFAFSAYNRRAA
jgi:hypothetical protein